MKTRVDVLGLGVYYRPRNAELEPIELNPHAPDFGHPERPDLLDILEKDRPHGDGPEKGKLTCLYCFHRRGKTEWMTLRRNPGGHGYHFAHHNTSIAEHPPPPGVSAKHVAFVEREVAALERIGITVKRERETTDRRARSDFRTLNAPVPLAGEVQVSQVASGTIARRTSIAHDNGLVPFWTTDHPAPSWMHRAPRAVVGPTTPQRIAAGTDLLVVGGAQRAVFERCGWNGSRCTATGRRLNCGRLHPYLEPARAVQLDDLLAGAATGAWKLLAQPTSRNGINYLWLPAADHAVYTEDRHRSPEVTAGTSQPRTRRVGRTCDRHDRRASCTVCRLPLDDVDRTGTHPGCDPHPTGWMSPRSVWGQPQ